jgi:isochorismate pyruvate lyase
MPPIASRRENACGAPQNKNQDRKENTGSENTRSENKGETSGTALRGAIDAMDDLLLPLLAKRLKLVASAARFKPSVAGVVIHSRVEEIVIRVRKAAVKLDVNPDCFEDVYRHLIDAYTREEQRNWKKLHR